MPGMLFAAACGSTREGVGFRCRRTLGRIAAPVARKVVRLPFHLVAVTLEVLIARLWVGLAAEEAAHDDGLDGGYVEPYVAMAMRKRMK
jgi:hypothetical protein